MKENKSTLRLIIEMLDAKIKKLKGNPLAHNGHRRYNGHMANESQPQPAAEFTGDPMQPSPKLLRQIAEANKNAGGIAGQWAQAFLKQYPKE